MPLHIVRDDITTMQVDAIVNAANNSLTMGGGVCGAIFAAAGADRLSAACGRIGRCETGEAALTDGFDLPARCIIHTVGPVWHGGTQNEEALLRACYTNSLRLARAHGLETVAFPLISSGIFGYPKDLALSVAISAIGAYLLEQEMTVYLVIFDRITYPSRRAQFEPIGDYIRRRFESADRYEREAGIFDIPHCYGAPRADYDALADEPKAKGGYARRLRATAGRQSEGFSRMLLRLIDARGKTDPEVYKRANIDRKLFSKIRGNPQYQPSKNTALALAVALELNLDETADLLRRAGYALSPASRSDLIVEYFIKNGNYDIFQINEALFAFDESTLGA